MGFCNRVGDWFKKYNGIQILEAEWDTDFRSRAGYGFSKQNGICS